MSEPDWFYLTSGGVDSVAAMLTIHPSVEANYQKKPVIVYLDTTVGIPYNRFYVEEVAEQLGLQLWTLRTEDPYADRIEANGCPGPADHGRTQNVLKGRQMDKLATVAGDPVFVTGISKDESRARARTDKGEFKRRRWHVKPVFELSREARERIVRESELPQNPLWDRPHFTDCGCGAYASPEELLEVESEFPAFAQRIREHVEAVETNDRRETWGWGAFDEQARRQEDAKNDSAQMGLCGPSCGAARDWYTGGDGR